MANRERLRIGLCESFNKVATGMECNEPGVDGIARHLLFQLSAVPMYLATLPEARLADVNQAWLDMAGIATREEVIGRTTVELGLFSDVPVRQHSLQTLCDGRRIRNMEIAVRTRAGDNLHLLANLDIVTIAGRQFILACVQDITARKQSEMALHEREKDLRRVLETAATGLARLTRDLRYVFANPPYARLVGVPVEQIVGSPMVDGIGQAALDVIRPCIDRVLRGERIEREIEVPFAHGSSYLQMTLTPDEDDQGRIAGLFVSFMDLTRQKSLEREVLHVSQAEQQRLAANLHDGICQDLTAISFTAKALERRLEKQGHSLAPEMGKIASSIAKTTSQARQIAQGMNPGAIGVEGLAGALRELASTMADDHKVSCSFRSTLPDLALDSVVNTQLFLIAQEAVRNAARHSGAARIEVELSATASELCLAVKDNGRGLPAGADQGPGLGLRGMRYRAGLIQGRLTVHIRESGGTEVLCFVPKRTGREGTKGEAASTS